MLGFSPLASSPLADDGGVRKYALVAAQGSFSVGLAVTSLPMADHTALRGKTMTLCSMVILLLAEALGLQQSK